MSKAKMATPQQIQNSKYLIKQIDEHFNNLDESTKRSVARYDWRQVSRVRTRIEKGVEMHKREGVTEKMYFNLVSFADQIFAIKLPNSIDFLQ